MAPMTDHGTSVGGKPLASPAATATTMLGGKSVEIKYNAPSMRGRKIMGDLVPYGQALAHRREPRNHAGHRRPT